MYCQLCRDIGSGNCMAIGTDNYHKSTLVHHLKSSDHKVTVVAPQRCEEMRKAVEKPLDSEERAVVGMKPHTGWHRGLPFRKYTSLIRLLKYLCTSDIDALAVTDRVN